ncbi:hypothetical protein [Saccharothrix hoggarensis]|uniref:Phage gp6-like head-tail connector protein n=1 Tax=Saccharothrix hoggarensis TaxID=913853 RepID=A0ABW3QDT2_9PSEU
MSADMPIPLCSMDELKAGAFADLAQAFDDTALARTLAQATRACETEVGRRLAPFIGLTESHRLDGVDPDEYGASTNLPLDLAGSLGRSRGLSLSTGGDLVRHLWLHQSAPHYPDLWSYTNVQVTLTRSYGGSQVLGIDQFDGPEPDTGHLWFRLGTWAPLGSFARVVYSGGYHTVPADLERACKYMAAAILCRELAPLGGGQQHDASELEQQAVAWLSPYMRAD